MSTFDDDHYRWRETYCLFHKRVNRPSVDEVRSKLEGLSNRFELQDLRGSEDGLFESITVLAPDAYAAIDVSYVAGEEVQEQLEALEKELKETADEAEEREKLKQLSGFDARFDLLHFEQVVESDEGDDEPVDFLDPSALLLLIEELSEMCDGVGVDPASASFV